jgi:hypothetical protein
MGSLSSVRWTLAAVIALGASLTARGLEPLDFNHDVRPILSDNCFKCHGFDDAARKGKLRLDQRATALKGGKSGDPAIMPGKPDESELVKRIFNKDPDEVMPPKSGKGPLTEAQKNTLKRWVAEGAEYQTHWAFIAPKASALPAVKHAEWARNEIDRLVLAKLEAQGLAPSKEADKYTLVRRLYLDLIGLPPTPEEADAFVKDASPDAYKNLLEKLLASPQYGERWARRWLDLARYADTNGFEKDRQRSVWPYRDWVIKAFNSDMPFDQFTVEQLAGDMLPNPTTDQRVATGFHRNTMRNEEGGIDPLEYRFYSVVDRTAVTGTTWLGLTVMCAQCHTHKYDPITHKDYYSLLAFLDNCDEPEADLPSPEITAKRAEIERKIAALRADLPNQWPAPSEMAWRTPDATATAASAKPEKQADGSWKFAGPAPDKDTYTFTFDSEAGAAVDAIRVETLTSGAKGPGRTAHGNFVLSNIAVSVIPKESASGTEAVKLARAEADFSQAEYPVENALKNLPKGGWGISPQEKKNHTATFYTEKPVVLPKGGKWTVVLQQQFGAKHTMGQVRVSLGSKAVKAAPEASKPRDEVAQHFAEWEKRESAKAMKWTVLRPTKFTSNSPTLTLLDDDSVLASGDITKSDVYDLTYHTDLTGIAAVRVEALPHESLPKHGPGMISYEGPFGDFSLSNITVAMNDQAGKFASAIHSFAAGNNTAANAIDDNLQTGWMINGGQGKAHQAVFVLATPTTAPGEMNLKLFFERYFACALGHFRISVTTDSRAAQTTALPPAVEAALLTPAAQRSESERALLMQRFLETAPELAAERQKIDALEKSLPNPPSTLVMTERPAGHERITRIHHRGEFLSPKDAVQADVPSFLPPFPKDAPRNRLTFARWLVSRENPLTARVAVNRQWQAFFGRGILKTVQDFGYQGDPPTHPELLDWLAIAFMDRGWSFKELDRLIVTSATYRQASQVSPELAAKDPENLLLARGPRFRVEAEILRDAALLNAGLLSSKMYGPSVFPPQLPSITTEGTYGPLTWTVSTGEDRYRRSLYTFTKRTAPFALYNTFDAPTGEACIARREVSDTPLQALALLNDQIFMEAAQALGKTIANTPDLAATDDDARATRLFRRCLTRPPAREELTSLVDFVRQTRKRFAAKELDPAKVAGATDGNVVERATWTAAARAVLNLDEAVTKD